MRRWFRDSNPREPVERLEARVLTVATRLEQATRELESLVLSLRPQRQEKARVKRQR